MIAVKSFEFTIVASCPGGIQELSEKLFEAGCDDATISLQKGLAILEFDREAKNLSHALLSALDNVTAAGGGVLHIEPDDLVSLSDIASRTGITRAAVSNYANGIRGKAFPTFPAPAVRVTTDTPLWDWVDVARWLFRQGKLSLTDLVQARVVRAENIKISDRKERRIFGPRRPMRNAA
jgi:transcriptional regulator with XRE-family HTH domain